MMRKKARRILDRLRGLTDGWLRGGTSVRGGLQEPQRLQALLGTRGQVRAGRPSVV
jgi:hypothetical protein